jgi:adenylate kinase family enzyme
MVDAFAANAPMRRVLVVGPPGAGKTTFALRLGEKLALPVIHLDSHFWRPGWRTPDIAAWRKQAKALAAQTSWVMDGNYSNTYDIRMPRADSLVWLDYPRSLCMRRVLMRLVKGYGRTRPDLADDCPEQFDFEFLRFVWNFPHKHRPHIPAGIAEFGSHLRVTRLAGDREAENYLAALGAS